ncbi:penicillin-binding protein 2 [Nocardioides jishulii]|uniref:Penicillin-binding protein 2 n=1 Tax=Nocardioides jishulii TaxID=2575440 RepID=A0A4U2YKW4_9ACTN|nr:penicillin-binding protein 2 [Nocardioides jishulii]QCX26931.1 penicillin-binding protein 2 [Nocardioides jishulii]TKI61414.1 penicillin-binding protein 2 [Nocardioides jishulii]
MAVTGAERSRLRLLVLRALVLTLFLTLFARLYYLQVVGGEDYQAKAADQSVRDIVVQPQRGLVVDDMGRPLVANRLSWVVAIDRSVLGKLDQDERTKLVARVATAAGLRPARVEKKLLDCGSPDAESGTCWNGSPFQAVPVATDIDRAVALRILEQPEDYPGVVVEQQNVRSYPAPFGVNLAHVLGYLSPITEEEFDRATEQDDRSLNGASVVGRAGVERQYDEWLRGMPGYRRVSVDSMGRVLGDDSEIASTPGDTLVTSIDAKVQSVVEKELARSIATQRATVDKVTGRRFEADSGAAVVLEAKTGRVVAMASQPTYDPEVWVDGISAKELSRLYSEKAGTPLLSRVTQGQFAPGSTWKPFMTAAALRNGYSRDSRIPCGSGYRVGNRTFKNFESGAYGVIGFAKALEVSCNTFFYSIGHDFWKKFGSDVDDVDARDPLVEGAQEWGFGSETGIDLPGEASGRIADRAWKRAYYEAQKKYYCGIAKKPREADTSDFLHRFAREFCIEGYAYRAGDAVNFSIGQGDTMVTPLQLAVGYAALSNGGTLWQPRVGKAIVTPQGEVLQRIKPKKAGKVKSTKAQLAFIDDALKGVASVGTMSWKLGGFPLDQVPIRAKTGSAEVYGKQSTGWVASYTKDYVVIMMISQGGTGSGSTGDSVRKIWETLYGVEGDRVVPRKAAIPGTTPPAKLPTFADDGSILPPVTAREKKAGGKR